MSYTVYQPGYSLEYNAQSGKLSVDGYGKTVTIKTPTKFGGGSIAMNGCNIDGDLCMMSY
jgi:phage baseplate assembly protein gpV